MQIKPNKSLSRQGMGPALSFTERAAVSSLLLHRISVVHVNLSHLIHNPADTTGQCPHQVYVEFQAKDEAPWGFKGAVSYCRMIRRAAVQ